MCKLSEDERCFVSPNLGWEGNVCSQTDDHALVTALLLKSPTMRSGYLVSVSVNGIHVVVDQVAQVQSGDVRESTAGSDESRQGVVQLFIGY